MKAATLLLLIPGLLLSRDLSAAEKEEAEPLRTEVYRLPIASLMEFAFCLPLPGEKSPNLPVDPFATPQKRPESDKRLTMQRRMERDGIEFPSGGYALFDWDHRALIVRTSEAGHQIVSYWLENWIDLQPITVHLQTHSIEFPAARLPALLSAMRDPKQAAATLRQLLTEATQPESGVRLRQCSLLELKSGQRSKLESALTSRHTQELTLNDKGVVQVVPAERPIGWTFECDPVLSSNTRFVDLNFSRTLTSPPLPPLEPRPLGPRFSWPVQDLKSQNTNTSITLESGIPVLAGHEFLRDEPGRIHAFFLTAHSLRIKPKLPPLPSNFNVNATPQEQITRTFTLPNPWPQTMPLPWGEKETPETRLREEGIELPFASVIRPLKNNRLRVTTTREAMTLVEEWARSEFKSLPRSLTFTLEVFQVPVAAALPLLEKAPASSNHLSLLSHVRSLAIKNQAQRSGYARLEAKSGQRATIETALQRQRLEKIAWHPGMKPEIETKWANCGLRAEIDPVLGGDGVTIDLGCQLQRMTGPPVQRLDEHQHPALENAFHLPYDTQPGQTLTSNHTLLDGDARLIAVWNPVSNEGLLQTDVLELVFLSAKANALLPNSTKTTPKSVEEFLGLPPAGKAGSDKMKVRIFPVPPDFLISSSSPHGSKKLPTPKEILEEAGIEFPPGSSAVYYPSSDQLIVRNLPKWLDAIADFCLMCYNPPRALHCETHLFELEASDLFTLEKKHPTHNDASALLDALLQKVEAGHACLVDSLSLLTKSGQRSLYEHVVETPVIDSLKISPQGHPQVVHSTLPAGTRFEIDSVLGGDGQTLDLNFALEHQLSPAQTRVVHLATPGQPPLEVPLTDHGQAKVLSSLTLIEGRPRIIAVWRPADLPGAEPSNRLRVAILKAHVQ